MPAFVEKDLCIGCQACVGACPAETISFTEESKAEVVKENCISCGICVNTCPMSAISLKESE